MTKILFYLPQMGLGGTEKTCLLFGDYLSEDFEPFLAYPEGCHHQERLEQFRTVFGSDNVIPITSTIQDIIDKHGIDIVHSFRSGYNEYPQPGKDFEAPHFVETNVFGHVDMDPRVERSLFMSEWLMDTAQRQMATIRVHIPAERWEFVNNPVEYAHSSENMRGELSIPDETVVLGRCGRPDPGIYDDINVKAALLLMSQGYDIFMLSVAPPENMKADLEKFGIPHANIEPTVDSIILSKFYNTVDIYTHARADGETFGVNIAEAMIHNKPVVTHVAVPSFPGMGVFQSQTTLVDNEVTGFVSPHEPGFYTDCVRKLIDDVNLRHSMGQAGRIKAAAEYHCGPVVRKLERIYRELING